MEFEKLQGIIAEVLNVSEDEITTNTTFVDDLGADSLDLFEIIAAIEEQKRHRKRGCRKILYLSICDSPFFYKGDRYETTIKGTGEKDRI